MSGDRETRPGRSAPGPTAATQLRARSAGKRAAASSRYAGATQARRPADSVQRLATEEGVEPDAEARPAGLESASPRPGARRIDPFLPAIDVEGGPDGANADEPGGAGLPFEAALLDALPRSGLAAPYEALEAESRVAAILGAASPGESRAARRRLEDPDDPLGRRFAWFPPSARHRLREIVRGRSSETRAEPAGAPVQRSSRAEAAPGGGEADAIRERAAQGVEGPGGALPFLPSIQASFGRHDVAGIEAHVGGPAAAAAADLGAAAYATGHHVAFAGPPDLHTAAHEAAHVVQQRAGVQLEGGVGQVGDPYEQHADAVADRVVRGESAEALLDEEAGEPGHAGSPRGARASVQRDALGPIAPPALTRRAPEGATGSAWLLHFAPRLGPDVIDHLQGAVVPTGHPRLVWLVDPGEVAARVWAAIAPNSFLARPTFAASVEALLAPVDLVARVDAARVIDPENSKDGTSRGPLEYLPEVAVLIAREVERAVAASTRRLGPRVVAAVDAMPSTECGPRDTSVIVPGAVALSHPIDRHVAEVLCAPGTGQVAPRGGAEPPADRVARLGPAGLRPVAYRFVEDAALWNWIRVTPPDASAEEVAGGVLGTSARAHELGASPPLFALPPDAARRLAPDRALAALRRSSGIDVAGAARQAIVGAGPEALAASAAADEAALAQAERSRASSAVASAAGASGAEQAGSAEPAKAGPVTLADRCRDQLDFLARRFAHFRAGPLLAPASARLDARRARLAALSPDEAARFAVLFGEQIAVLQDAAALLQGLEAEEKRARQARIRPGAAVTPDPPPDPARVATAEAILGAASLSDLPELARERLATLQRDRDREVFEALDAMLGDARSRSLAADPLVAKFGPELDPADNAALAVELRARQRSLAVEVLAAERARARGALPPPDLRALGERVRAAQVESRLVSAIAQCRHVARRLGGEKGVVAFVAAQLGDLDRARARLNRLSSDMSGAHHRWREEHGALFAAIDAGACEEGDPAERARAAIAALEAELRGLGDNEVRAALEAAVEELKDMAIARMVVDIAVMIGLTLVTSGLGTMAAGAAKALRAGPLAVALVDISTQSVAMAGLRAGLHGDSLTGALSTELITNVAGFGALRGLAHALHRLPVGRGLAHLAQGDGAWRYAAHGAELTIEAATQAGVQFAVAQGESMVRSGRPLDDDELRRLAIQGMGMFVGNAVAHRLARPAMDQLGAFAAKIGAPLRVAHVRKLADEVARGGDPVKARALLREDRLLLQEELHLHERIAADPAQLAAFGPETLATVRGQAEAHQTSLRDLTVEHTVRGRLHEIVPGEAWQGTPGTVADVLTQARSVSAPIATRVDPGGRRVHTVTSGDRVYTVYERPLAPGELEPPTPDGITGGKVRHEDFQGGRPPRAERRHARKQESAERAMPPREQRASIKTMTVRSEREMLEAIRRGDMPRYIARVGTQAAFQRHGTFADPRKAFVFATEPADLRGLNPAEAMSRVGWERESIRSQIGETIVVVILDTHVPVRSGEAGASRRLKLDNVSWKEVRKVALKDPDFLDKAARKDLTSNPKLEELFAIASRTPVKGTPATGNPVTAKKVAELRELLKSQYSANLLYSGMGATVQEGGQLGGREIMVRKNDAGLPLTPENHEMVLLGPLTQADFDAVFPSPVSAIHASDSGEGGGQTGAWEGPP